MRKYKLKKLLGDPRLAIAVKSFIEASGSALAVLSDDGRALYGVDSPDFERVAVSHGGVTLGYAAGPAGRTEAFALFLTQLADHELEKVQLVRDGLDNYREINLLYSIGERIFSCRDPEAVGDLILSELTRFVRADSASVMVYDTESDRLVVLSARGRDCRSKADLGFGRGVAGSILMTGRAEIINDVSLDSRYSPGENSVGSLLCAPLKSAELCLGVVNLSREAVSDFSARDLSLVTAVASHAGVAIENTRLYENILNQNRNLEAMIAERTRELDLSLQKVSVANRLIRSTFGRYLSEEVVNDILSSSDAGQMVGGETRMVTIMLTDLRGFTALSERLSAPEVLGIVNIYLEIMTDVILAYNGTILEFIGDAILVVFGAPAMRPDDAPRAVACAIEMQNAMARVNDECRRRGFPEVKQGIGINTGETVVGSIGSAKRAKYGLVGRAVNLASRIESHTVGGQILISPSTASECGAWLGTRGTIETMPKGLSRPMTLYDVESLGGPYGVALAPPPSDPLLELSEALRVEFVVLEGKSARLEVRAGLLRTLALTEGVMETPAPPTLHENLKVTLYAADGSTVCADVYAKVVEAPCNGPSLCRINFTSLSREAATFIRDIRDRAGLSD